MKSKDKKLIRKTNETKETYKNNMIETEYHEPQDEMISCQISEKTNRRFGVYFSPSREVLSPAIFPLYFYLQES